VQKQQVDFGVWRELTPAICRQSHHRDAIQDDAQFRRVFDDEGVDAIAAMARSADSVDDWILRLGRGHGVHVLLADLVAGGGLPLLVEAIEVAQRLVTTDDLADAVLPGHVGIDALAV